MMSTSTQPSVQHLLGSTYWRTYMVDLELTILSPITLPRIDSICSGRGHSATTGLKNRPFSHRCVNSFVPIGGYCLPCQRIACPCPTLPTACNGATVFSVNWSIRPEMGSQQAETSATFCRNKPCRVQRSFLSSWGC